MVYSALAASVRLARFTAAARSSTSTFASVRYRGNIQTLAAVSCYRPRQRLLINNHVRYLSHSPKLLQDTNTTLVDGDSTSKTSNATSASAALDGANTTTDGRPIISGTLYFDNVFPIKRFFLDPRSFFVRGYERDMARKAHERLLPPPSDFSGEFISTRSVPNVKEGGLLLHFKYADPNGTATVDDVANIVRNYLEAQNMRSWWNLAPVRAFVVKGEPFMEDMLGRLPTTRLRVEFDGPDVPVQKLYKVFRPYGRILNISPQPPSSKDLPRYAIVQYSWMRSASSARNCSYGQALDGTRISIEYEKIPILIGLLAGTTYIIFDPIRVWFVSNTLTGRFSLDKFKEQVGRWWLGLTETGLVRSILSVTGGGRDNHAANGEVEETWKERQAEEQRLSALTKETPNSLVLVTGPRGSGKSDLVRKAVRDVKYKVVIDCDKLINVPDHVMLSRLASQVGFYPMFNWLVSISGVLDSAVTALTGAKAGIASTTDSQVRKILEAVRLACTRITVDEFREREQWIREQPSSVQKKIASAGFPEASDIIQTVDSLKKDSLGSDSSVALGNNPSPPSSVTAAADPAAYTSPPPEMDHPVIIIEGFMTHDHAKQDFVYEMLAEWAAIMSENHLAHVVFVSNNPGAVKTLSKAIPTKTLETIYLQDASVESAMAYVRRRLGLIFNPVELRPCVEGLGGRRTDLQTLIQKIKAGSSPRDAFNDIVLRSITEIRKVGMGEDQEDAKRIPWSVVQFWKVVQLLAKYEEVNYDDLRFHSLFAGNEMPIQHMENAGLIVVNQHNGRPSSIRAGRPVYRAAFSQMVADPKLSSTMGVMTAKSLIASEEIKIHKWEEEMRTLTSVITGPDGRHALVSREARREMDARMDFLARMVGEAHKKVAGWDAERRSWMKYLKLAE
ncbi:mitochondrial escape protein 2 [Quaeritorhiza haematococci]|nr:mitochondrial escape protein 2 [Quaeritorhiza haematococci]